MDLYQQNIMDYYKKPRQQGLLAAPTHSGLMVNPLCGDKIDIHLAIVNDKIREASWQGEGCVLSLAAADMLAEYLEGKTIMIAKSIDQDWIIKTLGVKPSPSRLKCALLPLEALRQALTKN